MEYDINKGVGRSVEFKGLTGQYLFLFAFGLLAVLMLVIFLYLGGIGQAACILTGIVLATVLVWAVFRLNKKYGAHGLMKLYAARRHPRRIVSRRSITRLIRTDHEKHI